MVIYCIICGALTNYIGNKKNMNNSFWWGFLLGILGLITVAGLPMQKEKEKELAENKEYTENDRVLYLCVVISTILVVVGVYLFFIR